MVMSARSGNLTTLFLGKLRPPVQCAHTDNRPSCISGRGNESMWPYRVTNPGTLALESDALSTALRSQIVDSDYPVEKKKFLLHKLCASL